jgi:hypothetical protein
MATTMMTIKDRTLLTDAMRGDVSLDSLEFVYRFKLLGSGPCG